MKWEVRESQRLPMYKPVGVETNERAREEKEGERESKRREREQEEGGRERMREKVRGDWALK